MMNSKQTLNILNSTKTVTWQMMNQEYAEQVFNFTERWWNEISEMMWSYLRKSVYYYDQLFKGFDYSKRTFTSNILDSYNTNDLTSFQLLNRNRDRQGKVWSQIYWLSVCKPKLLWLFKTILSWGLNFYNQFYIGRIIKDGVFSMDIHSSYPYAMHNFKIRHT